MARVEAFEAVLPAAQAGAAWVARALWEALSVPVAGYLRSGGALEPEDLTSEVFLAVFEHLPQFRGDEPAFRAFVFTIAHRRLMDDLRRRYPADPTSCRGWPGRTSVTWRAPRTRR